MTIGMPMMAGGHAVPVLKPGATQVVAYTAAAGDSTALGSTTEVVRLWASTACYVKFAATATTADRLLPATTAEYVHVAPSSVISAIRVSGDGNLFITECV